LILNFVSYYFHFKAADLIYIAPNSEICSGEKGVDEHGEREISRLKKGFDPT
jgi:hypothetical protein